MNTVDVILSINTKVVQCLSMVTAINGGLIARCPYFYTDQHKVDAQRMVQL